MANNTITLAIPEVQYDFDPKAEYDFEEIAYPFNEENEAIRAMYGNDFRG